MLTVLYRCRDLALSDLPAFLTAAMAAFESARIRTFFSLTLANPPDIPAISPSHTVATFPIPHYTPDSAPPDSTINAPPPTFPPSRGLPSEKTKVPPIPAFPISYSHVSGFSGSFSLPFPPVGLTSTSSISTFLHSPLPKRLPKSKASSSQVDSIINKYSVLSGQSVI